MSVKTQIEIEDDLYERALPFIKNRKVLHVFVEMAFEEWVKRKEGRAGRALTQDEKKIEEIVRRVLNEVDRRDN